MKRDRMLKWIRTDRIIKNENNPRQPARFTADQLETLRASIATHGVLEPVIVTPYDEDMFELIDGERRLTSATLEGIKDVPAIVVNKMDDHDAVVVMYNVHTQHEGWKMAEEMAAIKRLLERNGHRPEDELAKELGMTVSTLKERLRVIKMGDAVMTEVAKGDLDYSSALRADQVANTLARNRPALVARLGGETAVKNKLLTKAKTQRKKGLRKGISQELVQYRGDLADRSVMADSMVEEYLTTPEAKMGDLLKRDRPSDDRRKVVELSDKLHRVERDIRNFPVEGMESKNLRELRKATSSLIEACHALETRVVKALMSPGAE